MAKYGVWNEDDYFDYTCSNCGETSLDINGFAFKSRYCPHCGAKMMNTDEKNEVKDYE